MARKIWSSGIAHKEVYIDGKVIGFIQFRDSADWALVYGENDTGTIGVLQDGIFEARQPFHAQQYHGKSVRVYPN